MGTRIRPLHSTFQRVSESDVEWQGFSHALLAGGRSGEPRRGGGLRNPLPVQPQVEQGVCALFARRRCDVEPQAGRRRGRRTRPVKARGRRHRNDVKPRGCALEARLTRPLRRPHPVLRFPRRPGHLGLGTRGQVLPRPQARAVRPQRRTPVPDMRGPGDFSLSLSLRVCASVCTYICVCVYSQEC